MYTIKATLVKETDGVAEFLYPRTSSDILIHDDDHNTTEMINYLLKNKVTKIPGKVLSDNDFTDNDKRKLDSIIEDATNYKLPIASKDAIGGLKLGYKRNDTNFPILNDNDGRLYAAIQWVDIDNETLYPLASSEQDGLMSAKDTKKLLDIDYYANNNTELKVASSTEYGAFKLGYVNNENNYAVEMDENHNLYVHIPWEDIDMHKVYEDTTENSDGLMSKEDKIKLDSISANANNYKHKDDYEVYTGNTEDISPNFGDKITVQQIVSDSTGHIASIFERQITIPSTLASEENNGLMPAYMKAKLDSYKDIGYYYALAEVVAAHNNIYKRRNLEDLEYSEAQIKEEIKSGSFTDIYPGDYIIRDIDGATYIFTVAGINSKYDYTFDASADFNHLEMVMDTLTWQSPLYQSGATEEEIQYGYVGSYLYQTIIPIYANKIQSTLTDLKVLPFKEYLSTYLDSSSGTTLVSSVSLKTITASLLSVRNVFGNAYYVAETQNVSALTSYEKQLPLFKLNNEAANDSHYRLRDYYYDAHGNIMHKTCFVGGSMSIYSSPIKEDCGIKLKFLLG